LAVPGTGGLHHRGDGPADTGGRGGKVRPLGRPGSGLYEQVRRRYRGGDAAADRAGPGLWQREGAGPGRLPLEEPAELFGVPNKSSRLIHITLCPTYTIIHCSLPVIRNNPIRFLRKYLPTQKNRKYNKKSYFFLHSIYVPIAYRHAL